MSSNRGLTVPLKIRYNREQATPQQLVIRRIQSRGVIEFARRRHPCAKV